MAATTDASAGGIGGGAATGGASLAGAGFTVMISGQIESGRALGYDSLSAEYFLEAGPDWTRVDGIFLGITQTAFRGGGGSSREAVWGMPLDATYRTTNVYGWPRLGVAVSAVDSLGRPVIVGYGSVLVPLSGAGHTRRIRLFAPVSSTLLQRVFAWATANPPRFWKSNIVTQGTGREVTRVQSTGTVTVTLNVVTRGMTRHGFNAGTEPDSLPAAFIAAAMSTAPGMPGAIAGGTPGSAGGHGSAGMTSTALLLRGDSRGGPGGGGGAGPMRRSVTSTRTAPSPSRDADTDAVGGSASRRFGRDSASASRSRRGLSSPSSAPEADKEPDAAAQDGDDADADVESGDGDGDGAVAAGRKSTLPPVRGGRGGGSRSGAMGYGSRRAGAGAGAGDEVDKADVGDSRASSRRGSDASDRSAGGTRRGGSALGRYGSRGSAGAMGYGSRSSARGQSKGTGGGSDAMAL